jgi:hypothetical protein
MGDACERLIALSGSERVGGYTRHSSTGKTVHVDSYVRSGSTAKPSLLDRLRGKTPDAVSGEVRDFSELRKASAAQPGETYHLGNGVMAHKVAKNQWSVSGGSVVRGTVSDGVINDVIREKKRGGVSPEEAAADTLAAIAEAVPRIKALVEKANRGEQLTPEEARLIRIASGLEK